MSAYKIRHRVFGATMLITGCCIGVGMIGLPIVSSLAGFMPASLAMLLCYIFTSVSGLLLLEATMWFDKEVNLPSIAHLILGKPGKYLTIFLFLFLFYCLFVAYLDAGGEIFAHALSSLLPFVVPHAVGTLVCMAIVVTICYLGKAFIDSSNRILILGMVISYVLLVIIGLPKVQAHNLDIAKWPKMFAVFPILLVCFGYQNLVPSITTYLQRNVRAVRLAILIGNFLPFLVYFIWNYVILGITTPQQIRAGSDAVIVNDLLQHSVTNVALVVTVIKSFSFFAIMTSFIPSTMSFVDFLRDGFSDYIRHKNMRTDALVYILIFLPTTLWAILYPKMFLVALSFAGGFIDVLLYGVLPATVVMIGRRRFSHDSSYQLAGGAVTPLVVLVISMLLLAYKIGL